MPFRNRSTSIFPGLEINYSKHLNEIALPPNVRVVGRLDQTLVTIVPPSGYAEEIKAAAEARLPRQLLPLPLRQRPLLPKARRPAPRRRAAPALAVAASAQA